MEKVINYIKEHQWLDIALIVILMIAFSFIFSTHTFDLYTDRGREFIFPEKILNGYVPYKDITMIYFPFSYYINALIYKILGVSIYSLLITQTIFCIFLVILFYFLSREFLNRKISLLLSIMIIVSCIFSVVDLFSFVLPYSYSIPYGLAGCWLSIFCLLKLYKTDNIKYAYIASLAGGFAFACKLEFLMALIILAIGLFFYKRLKFTQYLKLFSVFMIFPLLSLIILFIQGVTITDLKNAIQFGHAFATSDSMKNFLTEVGMTPFNYNGLKFKEMVINTMYIVQILFLSFLTLLLYKRFKNILILPLAIYLIFVYIYDYFHTFFYLTLIPIFIFVLICLNFKEFKKLDKGIILVIIASFLFAHRTFFCFTLRLYGTYAMPFIALASFILIDRFAPKDFHGIKTENLISFFLVVMITLYVGGLKDAFLKKSCPVHTSKGTLYTVYSSAMATKAAINFVDYVTDKNDSVLVLQEGSFINFATDRKMDMHCFMMDRLYYDAYGDEKAIELLKNANYDYILISNIDVSNFERNYLYEKDASDFARYIFRNYKELMTIPGNEASKIIIMKKRTPDEIKEEEE